LICRLTAEGRFLLKRGFLAEAAAVNVLELNLGLERA